MPISYDANGNPTVAYGPSGAMSLSYDGQNRLIKAGNDSFACDPAGHRKWKLIGPDNFINTGSNNDEYYLYDLSGRQVGDQTLRKHVGKRGDAQLCRAVGNQRDRFHRQFRNDRARGQWSRRVVH